MIRQISATAPLQCTGESRVGRPAGSEQGVGLHGGGQGLRRSPDGVGGQTGAAVAGVVAHIACAKEYAGVCPHVGSANIRHVRLLLDASNFQPACWVWSRVAATLCVLCGSCSIPWTATRVPSGHAVIGTMPLEMAVSYGDYLSRRYTSTSPKRWALSQPFSGPRRLHHQMPSRQE